jgi:hypothetical protein
MTKKHNPAKSLIASGQKSLDGFGPDIPLASNVTKENYLSKANDFHKMRGTGFLIALKQGKTQGVDYEETPAQWAAWRHYFVLRKISVTFMDRQGRDGKCWTVPAEWPSQFDSDVTTNDDYQAGEYFVSTRKSEHPYNTEAVIKRATVKAALGYDPSKKNRKTPPSQDHPQRQSLIDESLLLDSYNHGVAEMEAQREMKKQRNAR